MVLQVLEFEQLLVPHGFKLSFDILLRGSLEFGLVIMDDHGLHLIEEIQLDWVFLGVVELDQLGVTVDQEAGHLL